MVKDLLELIQFDLDSLKGQITKVYQKQTHNTVDLAIKCREDRHREYAHFINSSKNSMRPCSRARQRRRTRQPTKEDRENGATAQ